MRIRYRLHQFWHTLFSRINPLQLQQAYRYLSPGQRQLFDCLQASEKIHALSMLDKLIANGDTQPDLLVAALLHDVGKLSYRLNPFQRAMIVMAKTLLPGRAKRWGALLLGGWEQLSGWRKAFILTEHHAEWGAEMARQASASPLTVELIRNHHSPLPGHFENDAHRLQQSLWMVDNES